MTVTLNHLSRFISATRDKKKQLNSLKFGHGYTFKNLEANNNLQYGQFKEYKNLEERIHIISSASPLDVTQYPNDSYFVVFDDTPDMLFLVKVIVGEHEYYLTHKTDDIQSSLLDLLIIFISIVSNNTDILTSGDTMKKAYFDENMFDDDDDDGSGEDDPVIINERNNRKIDRLISKLISMMVADGLPLPLELLNPSAFSKKYMEVPFTFLENEQMTFFNGSASHIASVGDIDEMEEEGERDHWTINSALFKDKIKGLVKEYHNLESSAKSIDIENMKNQNHDRIESLNEWWHAPESTYISELAASTHKKTLNKQQLPVAIVSDEIDDELNTLIHDWNTSKMPILNRTTQFVMNK
jgi:hypothetical protein